MRTSSKYFAATLLALANAAALAPLSAAELLMFEDKGCSFCRRWHAEIGPSYPNTDEGKRAPLRRIDITGKLPDGITLVRPVTLTPTFVLVDADREIGRLTGYAGAEFFYELLADQLAKLPAATTAPKDGDSSKMNTEAAPAASKP